MLYFIRFFQPFTTSNESWVCCLVFSDLLEGILDFIVHAVIPHVNIGLHRLSRRWLFDLWHRPLLGEIQWLSSVFGLVKGHAYD